MHDKGQNKNELFGNKRFKREYSEDCQVMCSWPGSGYRDELWVFPAEFFNNECDDRLVEYFYWWGSKDNQVWNPKRWNWFARLTVSGRRVIFDDQPSAIVEMNDPYPQDVGCVVMEFFDDSRTELKSINWEARDQEERQKRYKEYYLCSWRQGDIKSEVDRKIISGRIKVRLLQQKFRNELLQTRGAVCCVTGCGVVPALEAAHIVPFAAGGSNHPSNGLLLRRDIHRLFDMNLINLKTDGSKVIVDVDSGVGSNDKEYKSLHGKSIELPNKVKSALRNRQKIESGYS